LSNFSCFNSGSCTSNSIFVLSVSSVLCQLKRVFREATIYKWIQKHIFNSNQRYTTKPAAFLSDLDPSARWGIDGQHVVRDRLQCGQVQESPSVLLGQHRPAKPRDRHRTRSGPKASHGDLRRSPERSRRTRTALSALLQHPTLQLAIFKN
jgi:hypothetical protein